jgi:meso-butanediol dehydrogenase/(S,S)-butanediol dehydrogenase/diacetyl reductase
MMDSWRRADEDMSNSNLSDPSDRTHETEPRVVVVTGAASGIGEATARTFAANGDVVVVVDRDEAAAASVAHDLRGNGSKALAITVDVRDATSVENAVDTTIDHFGRVDVLVNNAAIGVAGDVLESSLEDFRTTLDVNVMGVVHGCQAVIPHMLGQGKGIIVNVSSSVATVAVGRRAAYIASKGAVAALTRSIALDFMGRGIRCNAVAPGVVDSPWVGRIIQDQDDPVLARERMVARQPIGRLGQPREIAAAIAYLASPDADFVHGSCLVIDGGFSIA